MKAISLRIVFLFISPLILNPGLAATSLLVYNDSGKTICREYYSQKQIFSDKDTAKTILFALDRTQKGGGGSIHLAAGLYEIVQPLTIGRNTNIRGDGITTKLKFFKSKNMEAGIIVKKADGVTISDLSVMEAEGNEINAGIIVDNSGVCKIINAYVIGFQKYGIWLRNCTFLSRIDGCTVAGNKMANIYLDGLSKDGRYGNFIPNLITNSS